MSKCNLFKSSNNPTSILVDKQINEAQLRNILQGSTLVRGKAQSNSGGKCACPWPSFSSIRERAPLCAGESHNPWISASLGPLSSEFAPSHSFLKDSRGLTFFHSTTTTTTKTLSRHPKIWRKSKFWQKGLQPSVIRLTSHGWLGNGKGWGWHCHLEKPGDGKLGNAAKFYLS